MTASALIESRGHIALSQLGITLGGGGVPPVEAVRELDLEVHAGELVALLGPSGCGKSTLLGAVAGFVRPTRGRVFIDGEITAGPGADRGMVFQQHTLLPWRTIIENVAFGLKIRGLSRRERLAKARSQLGDVGLRGFEDHYPTQLSGGMQQRAELARVLVNEPRVILMDEPFGALDALTRLKMQALLLEVWSRVRTTILFVTHDIDEAIFLGDRVVVMNARPGSIRADLPVALPRPRAMATRTSAEFLDLRQRCFALLAHDES